MIRPARPTLAEVPLADLSLGPGQFTYNKAGGNASVAMAAAGVVCLQEFGQYDDWRITRSMEPVMKAIAAAKPQGSRNGQMPFDAYTLNYVGQSATGRSMPASHRHRAQGAWAAGACPAFSGRKPTPRRTPSISGSQP